MKIEAQKATRRSYFLGEKDGVIYLYPGKYGKAPAKAQIGSDKLEPVYASDGSRSVPGIYGDVELDLAYTLNPIAKAAKGKVVKLEIQVGVSVSLAD